MEFLLSYSGFCGIVYPTKVDISMGMKCANCKKGSMYGHNVSHAKNRTKKKFKPNLHYTKVVIGGTSKRVRLCTKCLRMYKRSIQSELIDTVNISSSVATV